MNSAGMSFSNLTYEPYEPTSVNISNNKAGYAAVKIEVIPAGAKSTITGNLNGIQNQRQALTTYVRSDESVGYSDALLMGIFYFALLVGYVLTFVYFVY